MTEKELSEKEILEMKEEFDKDLKKFHEKGVPEIVDIIGQYSPVIALFGLGSICNAIMKQQCENDEGLREQFIMYLSSTNIEDVTE